MQFAQDCDKWSKRHFYEKRKLTIEFTRNEEIVLGLCCNWLFCWFEWLLVDKLHITLWFEIINWFLQGTTHGIETCHLIIDEIFTIRCCCLTRTFFIDEHTVSSCTVSATVASELDKIWWIFKLIFVNFRQKLVANGIIESQITQF